MLHINTQVANNHANDLVLSSYIWVLSSGSAIVMQPNVRSKRTVLYLVCPLLPSLVLYHRHDGTAVLST